MTIGVIIMTDVHGRLREQEEHHDICGRSAASRQTFWREEDELNVIY